MGLRGVLEPTRSTGHYLQTYSGVALKNSGNGESSRWVELSEVQRHGKNRVGRLVTRRSGEKSVYGSLGIDTKCKDNCVLCTYLPTKGIYCR